MLTYHTVGDKFVAQGGTGTRTIARPDDLVVGNLLVFFGSIYGSPVNADESFFTLPAGFTKIRTTYRTGTNTGAEITTAYKIATADDVAAESFSFTVELGGTACALGRVTGHDPITPIGNISDTFITSDANEIVLPSLVANSGQLLFGMASPRAFGTVQNFSFSGLTSIWKVTNSDYDTLVCGTDEIVADGATGTRTISWDGGTCIATGQMFVINPETASVRYIPDVEPLYYIGTLLNGKTGIHFKVTAGHGSLNGAILGSGTNGTTDSLGNFVLPAGVTLSDQGDPVAAADPVFLHLYWEEGNPAVDRSITVKTTLVAEA